MAILINLKDAQKKLNELEGSAEYNKGVTDAFNALFDLPTIEAEHITCHDCSNYEEAKNGCNGFCKEWNTSTYSWEWCSRRAEKEEEE